jgi:hypothetical protein
VEIVHSRAGTAREGTLALELWLRACIVEERHAREKEECATEGEDGAGEEEELGVVDVVAAEEGEKNAEKAGSDRDGTEGGRREVGIEEGGGDGRGSEEG